jgi:large subunit ribosomal protein L25
MKEIELNASPRTVVGKQVKALRRSGLVPVIMYGQQIDPLRLQAGHKELMRVLRQAGGSRLIIVKTGTGTQMALAREVQREPISGQILHVDLLAVSMTERLRTEMPLTLEGKSPAVRRGEGILVTGVDSLDIECLPADLPDRIIVDLEVLNKVGDVIRVKDMKVSPAIKILTDPEEMVARVTHLAAEEVAPAAVVTAEPVEPEVIAKGKVEEEGEEEK